jgi:flagellar biosynthesis/type III secretory pathway M-ring protein FliF/YscJ
MDFLGRAYSQLHERFRSMTPGSRLSVALLAAGLLGGLCCLGTQQTARPDTDLLQGVPVAKSRLPRMIAAFGKAKLSDFVIRDSSIFVPRGRESKYMEALAVANVLPRGLDEAMNDAMKDGSIFDIGSSREQQRLNIAKQRAVADAIRQRAGIEDASVIYDETKSNGFQPKVAKAVVYVWPVASSELDEASVIDIRNAVVGAYAELKPENVTVSDLNGHTWRGSVGGVDESNYRALKQSRQQQSKAILQPFTETPAPPPAAAVDWIALGENAWSWVVQSWKLLAAIGAALVCLLLLRLIVRARSAETDEPAASRGAAPAAPPARTAAVAPPHWRRDAPVADRSLREEISNLVEEDPEAAANILRNWIGQVS